MYQRDRTTALRTTDGRVRSLVVLSLALGAVPLLGGCDKISGIFGERAEVVAQRKARDAIDAYSKASEQANVAHRKVIEAFAKANGAKNLAEYKATMREQVLPRMTVFVERLELMQTGTPELQKVHNILVNAYQSARVDMAKFVDELQSPRDLGRFNEIRAQLQAGVEKYRAALDAYYGRFSRKLRGGEKPVDPPKSATSTGP